MFIRRFLHSADPNEIVIESSRGWFQINFREIWNYRDLLVLLVRREFITKYRQTVLGPVWYILQPITLTITFTLTFNKLVGISTDGIPGPLFYLSGLLMWNYFVQCFDTTAYSLTANAGMFSKVYFPRLIIPLAAISSKLLAFAVQLACFLALYLYYYYFVEGPSLPSITTAIFYLPLALLLTAGLSLGAGLWMATFTVRYRDIGQLVPYLIQLLLYTTPIIYPASKVPEQFQFFIAFHPLAVAIENFRYAFFGTGTFHPSWYPTTFLIVGVILTSGIVAFNRIERNFVDHI